MKNFDLWNINKKKIENEKENHLLIKEREIWWCSVGINLGDEEDGKNECHERPVLILKKFNNKIFWGLPLSSKGKNNMYYQLVFYMFREGFVILSQLRIFSVKRLRRFMTNLSQEQYDKIINRIITLLK